MKEYMKYAAGLAAGVVAWLTGLFDAIQPFLTSLF